MVSSRDLADMATDAQLLARAGSDPSAFRELYDRYAERVYGYHRRRTGDDDAAHDLTAETFARCWEARTRFRDEAGGTAGPWLFTIARHVLVGSVRRGVLERQACERLGVLDRLDAPTTGAEPEERWLDGLDEALDDLPAGQREAIRLRVEEDLAYDDVAGSLRTSPAAARVSVHRGLTTLRTRLTDARETIR
jgi:RNA polymerase sigma factor (sigma-70 family)